MSFNQSSYGVMEDDAIVNIIIVLNQKSSVQFQVMINITDVTAVGAFVYYYIIIDVNDHVLMYA